MPFRLSPVIVGLALAAGLASSAPAQNAPNVATVNGKAIPKTRVEIIAKQQTSRGAADGDDLRRAIVDRLINFEVVVQEAEKKGLTRNADLQTQIDLARMQVIFDAYMNDYFRTHPIKDETAHAEYNRLRAQRGEKEYRVRHILVEKDSEAAEIIEQLKKGAKFEELAPRSKDPESRNRGGDLDWNSPGFYVKPFADALVKLEKGKITEVPVKTQFGYHVIRLDDVRAVQFPSFDQVKPRILQALHEQEMLKVVRDLRSRAKVE